MQPAPYGPPQQGGWGWPPQQGGQPPRQGGAGKTVGIVAGVVVALAAIGGTLFWFLGSKGLEDDGPHKLTTPSTTSFATYFRYGDASDTTVTGTDTGELEEIGIENPEPVVASYYEEDLGNLNTSDPDGVQEKLRSARNHARFTVTGAYGKIAEPKIALDNYFAKMQDNLADASQKGNTHIVSQLGVPEDTEADSLDGAVMMCAELSIDNFETSEDSRTTVCGWADYSTIALVTPYDGIFGLSTSEAAELTGKVRGELRVAG
ncbi:MULTISPECIES: hypothetical protein [unclassified Streptomyces]|uniref:hypothetical protein n=1 Tax=unclassified Streptomyces TaxID=2593676 RepID=UPI000DBACD2C|nr:MULTISPECIES: hypothetical protein [unclassified Streptomyces]MYT69141.1 hypothetical protein [Streptomyces sp. SID8367]